MLNLSFLQNFRNFFCKCWRIFVWLSFFAWMMTHWIIVKKNCFVGILKLSKISKNLVVYTIKALKLLQVLLYIVQGSIQSHKQAYLINRIRCSRCPDSNPWPKDYVYNNLSTAYLKKIEPWIFFCAIEALLFGSIYAEGVEGAKNGLKRSTRSKN